MPKGKAKETARHHEVFLVWYQADRSLSKTVQNCQLNERTLRRWIADFNWHGRADTLDAKANAKALAAAAEEKSQRLAQMASRHRQLAGGLQSKGAAYLQKHGVDNSAQAINAIRVGVQLERQSEGMPDWLVALTQMNDEELVTKRNELLAGLGYASTDSDSDDA